MKKIETDLVVVCCDRFFSNYLSRYFDFIVPEWIKFKMDITRDFNSISKGFLSSAKKDLKKIKSKGYTYEVTNNYTKKIYFYRRMFLPYITKRYNEELIPYHKEYIKSLIKRPDIKLILVKDEHGNDVSGGLMQFSKDYATLPSMGVKDGKMTYLKDYAVAALFYFNILEAKKHNIKKIDYGDTRSSFLDDGNFQFKRKWGMEVGLSYWMTNNYYIKIMNYSDSVEEFLEKNPFINIDPSMGKLEGFIYRRDQQESGKIIKIIKRYFTLGIDRLCIFSLKGFKKGIEKEVKEILKNNDRLRDLQISIKSRELLGRDMDCLEILIE